MRSEASPTAPSANGPQRPMQTPWAQSIIRDSVREASERPQVRRHFR